MPSVGEPIPGHPLSVGESAREGGRCKGERGKKQDDRLEREREMICNSINASHHSALCQMESFEYISGYFVAVY